MVSSMADASLRELERRFRETGLLEDEVRWLVARRRAGDEARLEVAALCGYHPALAALERRPAPPVNPPAWCDALSARSVAACVVAACALARELLPHLDEVRPRGAATAALEAAEAWLACPCRPHELEVAARAAAAREASARLAGTPVSVEAVMAARAAHNAASVVLDRHPTRGGGHLWVALVVTQAACGGGPAGLGQAFAALRAALVFWALGLQVDGARLAESAPVVRSALGT